ncbi:MAG: acetate--CoA ligase, partial [Planctomycetaceae bacterium]|nr:acetate--CoA ligase [Planctomycetaceae bacterium]
VDKKYPPSSEFKKNAHIKSMSEYKRIYRQSIDDPEGFWAERALELTWDKKWKKVLDSDFEKARIKWFVGGKINASYNCLDRHVDTWRKNKAALIWVGDEPGEQQVYTYQRLHQEVSKFANVLKKQGIKKGDRVAIYLSMIPQLPIAMLACARIGAIHSIIFGGFSPDSLKNRIKDCAAKALITADAGYRGGRLVPLKENADEALRDCPEVKICFVVRRSGTKINMEKGRDLWWHEEMNNPDIKAVCKPTQMDAEDPLFILYTSGSTGKPKGVLHTTGGYLLFAAMTHEYVFDYHDGDVYWCTADVGWVTGHSYIVYGPMANGAKTLMFEGVPTYPDSGRFWEVCAKHKVNQFYTAPTAIRALMAHGPRWVEKHDLSSLKVLGTVGEPINPEAWNWYNDVVGKGNCPIVDTWWQTETGGIMMSPLPGAIATKPGSCTKPLPGILPAVVDEQGEPVDANMGGLLVITHPWPGMLRGIWGDEERYREQYWEKVPHQYLAGDNARVDNDGYYWIMGRIDDVINVSGHRLSTIEVESALVSHPNVAEAAAVGRPDEIKGQAIAVFVTLLDAEPSDALRDELKQHVRKEIGALAQPDDIRFTGAVPKTRSGKIMRRLLRDIASGKETVGDTTTLEDYSVLAQLRDDEE